MISDTKKEIELPTKNKKKLQMLLRGARSTKTSFFRIYCKKIIEDQVNKELKRTGRV